MKIKCNECNRINQKTTLTICDRCIKEMSKPIRTGVILFITIILLSIIIYISEYEPIWFIAGLLIGYVIKDIIEKEKEIGGMK